jgi:cytoskeletal protein CcmA (bactofilin family)
MKDNAVMDARLSLTRVPAGISISGEIHSQEDITIDGRLDGQLNAPAHHLEVRPGAVVRAKIVAGTVRIAGTIDGTVVAADSVVVEPTANVRGHVVTPTLTLREGAQFNGTVDPTRTEAAMHVAKYRKKQEEQGKPAPAKTA